MTRMMLAALALAALAAVSSSAGSAPRCSSLNGPFCVGVGVQFALETPLYASQDLAQEDDEQADVAKRAKIESVLKQYEQQEAASQSQEIDVFVDVEMLLEETAALLGEPDSDEPSPFAGAFAFSSEGGAFEQLETMDGHELKDFFEVALDEVLQSVEVALQDLSPEAAQGVRTTARQMKAVSDFSAYSFQRLDDSLRATARRRFANHRLVELQQTFERLVVARTAQDRQLAFEMCIFLFQLAQEQAAAAQKVATNSGEGAAAVSEADVAPGAEGAAAKDTPAQV